ncbi:MAG: sodium:proton antiporter [Epsilonproteobacteria bacterium]|nr:sodium:proton antiporter [Campylobacterota bacterium]
MELNFTTLIPSLLAIFLALRTKNVYISLLSGIIVGLFILSHYDVMNFLKVFFSFFTELLSQSWIIKTLLFALLVGSVIEVIQRSGSIDRFVVYVTQKKNYINSPKKVLGLSYIIGVLIFIESSITSLIAGAVGRPLCDREKIPHAKLAFVCDSTSAPISSLILLNGWGALLLGLIQTQKEQGIITSSSLEVLLESIKFNFYAFVILGVTLLFIFYDFELGAMKKATPPPRKEIELQGVNPSLFMMIAPLFFMIINVFMFLYITGDGDIFQGSGSSSVFYTMVSTLVFLLFLYVPKKILSFKEYWIAVFDGMKKLFGITVILFLAFGIGKITSQLHTGEYLASLALSYVSDMMLYGLIFLIASMISFSTGTSWGTFSIMIPIALPMAYGMDGNIALAVGAVVSGGVFGDHCSPISDTTIISSLASDCDVVEHVKTQLPYALIAGGIAFLFFVIAGIYI